MNLRRRNRPSAASDSARARAASLASCFWALLANPEGFNWARASVSIRV